MYMYEEDLALNNLQWLTCDKTKPNQTKIKQNKPNENVLSPTQMLVLSLISQLCMGVSNTEIKIEI